MLPVPWSLGNAASKPSTRNRFMSTNCRDSSARPFFVVTAADRITIFKCYRSRVEKNKSGARGCSPVARPKSPGLPLRLFRCVRRRSKRCAAALFALPRGRWDRGQSAALAAAFHARAAGARTLGARKKRSRPGNCARRRRLLKALKATPAPAFYLLVSYRTLALVGPARRRGVFRSILRQPKRRVYAASGAGEAEEHAIFAWPSFVRVRCLQYDARGSPVRSCGETAADA